MRIFIRVLLTLYILFVLCIAVLAALCAWNIIGEGQTQVWLGTLYSNVWSKIIVTAAAFLLILISFVLMFARTSKKEPASALITETGIGSISVSLSAIEEIVVRHLYTESSVRNAKVGVRVRDSKVYLNCKLAVSEGTNIPNVLTALQTGTKQEIETYAGVEVGKISILVEKTSQVVKARVE